MAHRRRKRQTSQRQTSLELFKTHIWFSRTSQIINSINLLCSGVEAVFVVENTRVNMTTAGTRLSGLKSTFSLTVGQMRCSTSAMNALPSCFFKDVIDTLSSDVHNKVQHSHWYSS